MRRGGLGSLAEILKNFSRPLDNFLIFGVTKVPTREKGASVTDWLSYGFSQDRPAALTWGLPIRMSELEDQWLIKAELPQVDTEQIDLVVSNHALTITAPGRCSLGTSDTGYYRAERQLPTGVFTEEIRARYCQGVLEISLPKSQTAYRRVPIES